MTEQRNVWTGQHKKEIKKSKKERKCPVKRDLAKFVGDFVMGHILAEDVM